MTFDPEKLRNLLLGRGADGEATFSEEGAKPAVDPRSDAASVSREEGKESVADDAGKKNLKPNRPPVAPVEKTVEELDALEKVKAEYFAPSRSGASEAAGEPIEQTDGDNRKENQVAKAAGSETRSKATKGTKQEAAADASKKIKPQRKRRPILPPGPLSLLALCGGGLALLGAVIAIGFHVGGKAPIALAGIGLVLVAAFALVNRAWIRLSLSGRSARYTANVSIAVLSLFGILVLLNLISYNYYYRLDVSAGGSHTLSQQTLKVLDDINRAGDKVTVTAFVPASPILRPEIESRMELYTHRSGNIHFSFVDPDVKKELTSSKGITRIPSVLFELGDRREIATETDEAHLTSALMAVRQTTSRTAAFLMGHGELDPDSDDSSQTGLSMLRKRLELDGFAISKLRIPESRGIPVETSLLIIAAPERDLDPPEIDAIAKYLDNGGSIMAFLEPGHAAGLGGLLAEYGIVVNNDTVLDDQDNYYADPASPRITGNPDSPIASSLSDGMLFLHAGSLDFSTSSRLPKVETTSVARSSASSWSESTDDTTFKPDVDKREAREMAVLSVRSLESSSSTVSTEPVGQAGSGGKTPPPSGKVAEVFVVNDASFIQNANLNIYMNRDFALNAASFLTQRTDVMAIRPAEHTVKDLQLSKWQLSVIFAFSVILTPLLVAGLGVWVWMKRR